MTARAVLDGIKQRLAGITPGSWVHGGNGYIETVPEFDLHRFDIMPETIARTELRDEDATFIAAAPTTVARLVEAVEGVLALHPKSCEINGDAGCAHFDKCSVLVCGPCGESWPCPTVAAIDNALTKESQ